MEGKGGVGHRRVRHVPASTGGPERLAISAGQARTAVGVGRSSAGFMVGRSLRGACRLSPALGGERFGVSSGMPDVHAGPMAGTRCGRDHPAATVELLSALSGGSCRRDDRDAAASNQSVRPAGQGVGWWTGGVCDLDYVEDSRREGDAKTRDGRLWSRAAGRGPGHGRRRTRSPRASLRMRAPGDSRRPGNPPACAKQTATAGRTASRPLTSLVCGCRAGCS